MKFAVSILAASLVHAACVAAAPAADAHGDWRSGFWLKGRRLRNPWSRKRPSGRPSVILPTPTPSPTPFVPEPSAPAAPAIPDPEPAAPEPTEPTTPEPEPAAPYVPSPDPPAPPAQTTEPPPPPPASPTPTTTTAPAPPANTGVPSGGSGPTSGGKALIDTANLYRQKAGLPLFTWDDKLAANALKTGNDAGGKALVHQLGPGTFGQVLVFGYDDADKCTKDSGSWTPFELYYLSWLCERPNYPALGGVCTDVYNKSHISTGGQTGHHDILISKSYTKIGCAFARDPSAPKCDSFPGVWACDLGS